MIITSSSKNKGILNRNLTKYVYIKFMNRVVLYQEANTASIHQRLRRDKRREELKQKLHNPHRDEKPEVIDAKARVIYNKPAAQKKHKKGLFSNLKDLGKGFVDGLAEELQEKGKQEYQNSGAKHARARVKNLKSNIGRDRANLHSNKGLSQVDFPDIQYYTKYREASRNNLLVTA